MKNRLACIQDSTESKYLYKINYISKHNLIIYSIFAFFLLEMSVVSAQDIFIDNFDDLSLAKWDRFGSPSSYVLGLAEGRSGIFNNNGDSMYDSGATTKETFSLQNGFTLESDIFLKITARSASFALVDFGLTDTQEPDQLEYGIEWLPNKHAYLRGHFLTENGNHENYGFWDEDDAYINGWHNWKVVVGADRYVKFYLDGNLIYSSQSRIDTSVLEGKKLSISGRSYDGKAYNDYVKISPSQQDEINPDLYFKSLAFHTQLGEKVTIYHGWNTVYVDLILSNKGKKSVDKVKVELYIEKEGRTDLIDHLEVENIDPGSDIPVRMFLLPPDKSNAYDVYAIVDPDLLIPNEDKSNNKISSKLKILVPMNLESRIISPNKNEQILYPYQGRDRIIPVQVEIFDKNNNKRIDFVENSNLIGYIDALPLKGTGLILEQRTNIKIRDIIFSKVGDKYIYNFDTKEYKKNYGKEFLVTDIEDTVNAGIKLSNYSDIKLSSST